MSNTLIRTPIRIAVAGASGRMGRKLIQAVNQSKQATLCAVLSRASSGLCGADAGEFAGIGTIGVKISNNLTAVKDDFDVLIDFTSPNASLAHLNFCNRHCKEIVIGTTGFNNVQKGIIKEAAQKIGIVFAPNFSVNVNLMLKLLEKVAHVIGEKADIEIIEMHHRDKADTPSGTALAMERAILGALGCDLACRVVYNHEEHTSKFKTKSIGFSTVRAGDIVGEHTVIFAEYGERLEITHKASSRMSFAIGAVRAAIWLCNQKNGLYDMANVLNFDKL